MDTVTQSTTMKKTPSKRQSWNVFAMDPDYFQKPGTAEEKASAKEEEETSADTPAVKSQSSSQKKSSWNVFAMDPDYFQKPGTEDKISKSSVFDNKMDSTDLNMSDEEQEPVKEEIYVKKIMMDDDVLLHQVEC